MKNYLIAERYAKALCSSLEDEALSSTGKMLKEAAAIFTESEMLHNLLQNPAIDLEKRREVLRPVLAAAELDESVIRLAEVLLLRGRIEWLPDVAVVFGMLADVRLNRVRATVTTAAEITPEQEERLVQALKTWSGKDVRMEREVVPDILGGVIARVGDTVIDGSVHTRIKRLREFALEYDIRVQDAS
jgi:F-type H+-transporting ATPase subunit delta